MSTVNSGPSIIKSALILDLDASARRSFLPNSLINMNTWTVSTGSVTGYGINGNTAENQRIFDANPWGDTDIVWGTYPSGDGYADGGWNGDGFNIDNTKIYRFSVWVRRTSSTASGSYYLGLYGNGTGIVQMSDNVVNNNSYWYCNGISELPQNTWYLLVGHAYPWNTTYTGRHPDTGYYLANNPNKVTLGYVGCNIGSGDVKWSSNTTSAQHRAYHYYCGDSTSRLQFYDPRVDLIDGKQPSITELVKYSPAQWRDLSATSKTSTLYNKCLYNTIGKGSLYFDGLSSFCGAYPASSFEWTPSGTSSGLNNMTIDLWVKTSENGGYILSKPWNGSGEYNYLVSTSSFGLRVGAGNTSFSFTDVSTGNWTNLVILVSPTQFGAYINGVQNAALTNHGITTNTPAYGNSSLPLTFMTLYPYGSGWAGNTGFSIQGNLGSCRIYNRVLTAQEILQNYQQTKSRFGL